MTRGLAMTKRWDYELYIDGAWTSDGAEGTLDVIDPATEESIGSVPDGSVKTAVQAITAARRAFDSGTWPSMKPAQRAPAPGSSGDNTKSTTRHPRGAAEGTRRR